jgi:cytochrome c oxidase cbb3-type subunit 3
MSDARAPQGLGTVAILLIGVGFCAAAGIGWFVLGRPRVHVQEPTTATAAQLGPVPVDEAGLRAISHDAAWLARGKKVYGSICWNCHGANGEGGQGPNLRDQTWIIEPSMINIVQVISEGKPGTAMQAMGSWYSAEELAAVAAYVADLHRHPGPTGKEAEGLHDGIDW